MRPYFTISLRAGEFSAVEGLLSMYEALVLILTTQKR